MTPLLRAENLRIVINRGGRRLTAVNGISFELHPGEILGIVGESGCGKSLTALSLAGLLPAAAELASGSVRFEDRELAGLPEEEFRRIRGKDLSFIFQEPFLSLNPLVRAGPQIEETLLLRREKAKPGNREEREAMRKQVIDMMKSLGLEDAERVYKSYPHELSGGMCQRVMIALAMICGPKLLIADEPTTALDVTIQAQILDLIRRINRESGTGILFISHDLKVIRSICTRVLVMYAGKIVEAGPAAELFSSPLHEYTKGLAGSIPGMDFPRDKALANIPGRVPPLEEQPEGCPFAPRCGRAEPRCYAEFPAETRLGPAGGEGNTPRLVHCVHAETTAAAEPPETPEPGGAAP